MYKRQAVTNTITVTITVTATVTATVTVAVPCVGYRDGARGATVSSRELHGDVAPERRDGPVRRRVLRRSGHEVLQRAVQVRAIVALLSPFALLRTAVPYLATFWGTKLLGISGGSFPR